MGNTCLYYYYIISCTCKENKTERILQLSLSLFVTDDPGGHLIPLSGVREELLNTSHPKIQINSRPQGVVNDVWLPAFNVKALEWDLYTVSIFLRQPREKLHQHEGRSFTRQMRVSRTAPFSLLSDSTGKSGILRCLFMIIYNAYDYL